MDLNLKNKTIILTGAARIGQEVGNQLKKAGANLVVAYFNDPKEAENLGKGIQADVSKKEDIEKVVDFALNEFGSVFGLVHMAAIYQKSPWETLNEKDWQKNMDVIAKSSFLFGKILGDKMLLNNPDEKGIKGKIVFFSDWSVLTRPYADYLAYNASKAAVVGLTKSFAKALAPHILVNAVAPGPMMRPPDLSDLENEEAMAGTPLKRWGGADEIAKGVCYLMSADFVTGQILTIDGGRTIA